MNLGSQRSKQIHRNLPIKYGNNNNNVQYSTYCNSVTCPEREYDRIDFKADFLHDGEQNIRRLAVRINPSNRSQLKEIGKFASEECGENL